MKNVIVLTKEFGYSPVKLAYVTGASLRTVNRWIKSQADPLPIFEIVLEKLVGKEQRKVELKEARALQS